MCRNEGKGLCESVGSETSYLFRPQRKTSRDWKKVSSKNHLLPWNRTATRSQFCQDTPYQWFERTRIKIPPKQQKDVQARLIFEIQTAFMVECTDLLIDELIHRRGRIQQSLNASRQKVENDFRSDSLESIRAELKEIAIA